VAVLDTVEAGQVWASRQVTDFLLAQAIGGATALDGTARPALFQALTRRETEIAEQVAAGHSNKMIAAEAGITERTVKTHLNNIFRKTGVRNRVQLALAVNDAEDPPRRLSSG
jgi:DNA-binding NarL/FixJ family response regulator